MDSENFGKKRAAKQCYLAPVSRFSTHDRRCLRPLRRAVMKKCSCTTTSYAQRKVRGLKIATGLIGYRREQQNSVAEKMKQVFHHRQRTNEPTNQSGHQSETDTAGGFILERSRSQRSDQMRTVVNNPSYLRDSSFHSLLLLSLLVRNEWRRPRRPRRIILSDACSVLCFKESATKLLLFDAGIERQNKTQVPTRVIKHLEDVEQIDLYIRPSIQGWLVGWLAGWSAC